MTRSLRRFLKEIFQGLKDYITDIAREHVESELHEKELLFTILILGPLLGLPVPSPVTEALNVLPHMIKELEKAQAKTRLADDPFSLISSLVDVT